MQCWFCSFAVFTTFQSPEERGDARVLSLARTTERFTTVDFMALSLFGLLCRVGPHFVPEFSVSEHCSGCRLWLEPLIVGGFIRLLMGRWDPHPPDARRVPYGSTCISNCRANICTLFLCDRGAWQSQGPCIIGNNCPPPADKRPFLALALVVPLVQARAIRSTPAEALGLIDQAWSIGELLDAFPLNLTLRDCAFTKSVAVFLGSAPLLNLA